MPADNHVNLSTETIPALKPWLDPIVEFDAPSTNDDVGSLRDATALQMGPQMCCAVIASHKACRIKDRCYNVGIT